MDFKIDWYSFTLPLRGIPGGAGDETIKHIDLFLELAIGEDWVPIAGRHIWQLEKGRGFYSFRIRNADTKVCVSWGDVNPHVYIECSGEACDLINRLGALEHFIEKTCNRASRIDFAVDIETDCDPQDFIVNIDGQAFKTTGSIVSENGKTCYIGSRKSERMARVYRYSHPHPRSHLLRVEAEYKGEAAKIAARAVICEGVRSACLAAHLPFRWKHPVWKPDETTYTKLPARKYDTEQASTVRWLYGTVAQSLLKAHQSDLINLAEWLQATGLQALLQPPATLP